MKQIHSRQVVWSTLLIIVGSSFWHHTSHWDSHINVLSWDVYGYYLYLPGLFIFHDVDTYQFTTHHLEHYQIAHSRVYQVLEYDGQMLPTYTLGMALLYLPFYLIGNMIAACSSYAQDGLSAPYQWSIVVGSWLYCLLGLHYLRKVLLPLGMRDAVVSVVLVAVGLGTNYFHYAAFESGMPHSWLFALYAVLLYHIVLWHNTPTYKYSIIIGVVSALLALARPSEGILILLFLLYGLGSKYGLRQKMELYISTAKPLLTLIGTGTLLVSVQVLFWYLTAGKLLHNSYGASGHEFHFSHPHIIEGLFSYRKGWLLYTPVMLVAIFGLGTAHKYRELRWGIIAFLLLNIYIVLSWHMWWYANSFGMRALVQSYPILAVPMAALLDKYWATPKIKKVLLAFIAICVMLNQFQNWQYRHRILRGDKINKAFYWKSFGKTTLDKDLRKYLDLPSVPPAENKKPLLPTIFDDKSATDTTSADRRYSTVLKYKVPLVSDALLHGGQWIEVSATLLAKSDKYGQYDQAKLVCNTVRGDKSQHWVGVRVQDIVPIGEWQTVSFPYQLTADLQPGDEVRVVLWNQSPDTILVKDIVIYKLD